MEKNELIQRLEQAPGKTFVEDGYFYGYALIKRVTVLYYTPEIKL